MKTIILLLLIGLLVSSCVIIRPTYSVVGKYCGKTPAAMEWIPSGRVTLTLHQNGRFDLNWKANFRDIHTSYAGKWEKINAIHVWLDFDEVGILEQLGTYGVSYKDREIELIGNNEIRMDDFMLKRRR